MKTITRAQREKLYTLYVRTMTTEPYASKEKPLTYSQFRRRAFYDGMLKVLMVPFAGMVVGIEADGHSHS